MKCCNCHHTMPEGRQCRRCKQCNKVYMRIYRRNIERAKAGIPAVHVLELPPMNKRYPGVDIDAIHRRRGRAAHR